MSEPGDELTPLPEQPPENRSRFARSPYLSLGVAAVVVSTVFATVAALASSRDEDSAAPSPQSRGTVESTTFDTDTTDPTTTTSGPGTSSPTPTSSTTTTTEETTEDETTTEDDRDDDTRPGSPEPPPDDDPTTPPDDTTTTPPPNKAPAANFTFSCEHLDCTFDGNGSSDPDGTIASYSWSFGATGATAARTYPQADTYSVTLTVTDDDGETASTTKSVTVEGPPDTTTNTTTSGDRSTPA